MRAVLQTIEGCDMVYRVEQGRIRRVRECKEYLQKRLENSMNILVSINSKYKKTLEVLLYSLRLHCKSEEIDVYLINKSLLPEELVRIEGYVKKSVTCAYM